MTTRSASPMSISLRLTRVTEALLHLLPPRLLRCRSANRRKLERSLMRATPCNSKVALRRRLRRRPEVAMSLTAA